MAPDGQVPDYGAWMKSYGPILRRWLNRRIHPDDIDDVVQDIFLRIQMAQKSRPVENIESYLFTTARHVLINRYRARSQESAFLLSEQGEVIDLLSPERFVFGFEEYDRVITAIVNLPPRARQAFELSRFENLSYPAIAQHMGITMNSAKELVHRALVRIAQDSDMGQ